MKKPGIILPLRQAQGPHFDKLRDRLRQAQESKWVVEPVETIRGNGSLSLSKRSGGKNRHFDKLRDHLRQAQESKWVVEPVETTKVAQPMSLRQAQGPHFDKLRDQPSTKWVVEPVETTGGNGGFNLEFSAQKSPVTFIQIAIENETRLGLYFAMFQWILLHRIHYRFE